MSNPPTLTDTTSATSSEASEAGHMPSNSPDGEMSQSGLEASPVSPSPSLENEKAMPTNATSGQCSYV